MIICFLRLRFTINSFHIIPYEILDYLPHNTNNTLYLRQFLLTPYLYFDTLYSQRGIEKLPLVISLNMRLSLYGYCFFRSIIS